uniref:Peptidase M3A/M3B catalytic domain-containing protein n=1 Tax=Ditylenchus dipsaci TaxID=166011 RepID=A0A915E1M9_9BILA
MGSGLCQSYFPAQAFAGSRRPIKFFNFGAILSGFESIVNKLYGLDFKVSLPEQGEVWPGNVLKLDVHKEGGTVFLGTIYLDMDIRSTKVQGDCHFTVRCSKLMGDGQYQTPIVVLSLSVMPLTKFCQRKQYPSEYESVMMDPQQAENFFHEMGHAIHSMLGRTRYQHVAGTRCPSDFAEVPSHLMECFLMTEANICRDPSGKAMTIDEANVLLSSRNIFGSIRTSQQALYALFDLQLHGQFAHQVSDGSLSTTNLFQKLADVALPCLERTPNYAYHHRISHLVTYGAKYYSYLVARAGASLIYENLFSENPFSRENGLKWGKIQSFGGEYPSHYLLEKVLDRKPGDEELSDVLQESILADEEKKRMPYI